MAVHSKLISITCTCKDFQHPWTNHCSNASVGLLMASAPYCLRVYSMAYVLSMITRRKIPSLEDIRKMIKSILQSTAFLVTNSWTFIFFNCLIRKLLGRYYVSTVAYVPCFFASLTAILVERPQRRPLLALYVANVATETLWNMLESRRLVKSIPNGQAVIFGASISILLYLYRLGLHKTVCKDSLFDILRIFVGKAEEGSPKKSEIDEEEHNDAKKANTSSVNSNSTKSSCSSSSSSSSSSRASVSLQTINGWVQVYARFMKGKHESCPHKEGCFPHVILGGLKPFLGGVSLTVALKLLMNVKRIAQFKFDWRKTLVDIEVLNMGFFLGSFSFLYKSVSCSLRHICNKDDPKFAIPAGLIGSIGFIYYPEVTVALYVMWKTLQVVYNLGIEKKKLPRVKNFTLILYAASTALLFHAGILEPKNLRSSYYKFLQAISGERLSKFDMVPLDAFGLQSSQTKAEVMNRLRIVDRSILPKFAMAD